MPFKKIKRATTAFSTFFSLRLFHLTPIASAVITGIVFGLVVNTATLMLQETITKQKYFEALEHEVMQNYSQARALVDQLSTPNENSQVIGTLLMRGRYRDDIWTSGNALGYIYSIDQELQSQMYIYYSFNVQTANKELDYIENSVNQLEYEYTVCLLTKASCPTEKKAYDAGLSYFQSQQLAVAQNIYSNSETLMSKFHPSSDRVHSLFLRFFMGDKIVPILKRDQ